VNYIPKFDDIDESPLDLPCDPKSVCYDPNDGGDANAAVVIDDKEGRQAKEGEDGDAMEMERAMMMAAQDAHRNEAMRIAGDVSVRVDHESLAAALVLEAGDGGIIPSNAESVDDARASSSYRHYPAGGSKVAAR
jgi:hypothetical protein